MTHGCLPAGGCRGWSACMVHLRWRCRCWYTRYKVWTAPVWRGWQRSMQICFVPEKSVPCGMLACSPCPELSLLSCCVVVCRLPQLRKIAPEFYRQGSGWLFELSLLHCCGLCAACTAGGGCRLQLSQPGRLVGRSPRWACSSALGLPERTPRAHAALPACLPGPPLSSPAASSHPIPTGHT